MRYHLFCLITICIFSTLELVGKKIGASISPFAITAWRFLIGGVLLLPFAIRQNRVSKKNIKISSILSMAILGFLNVCVSMLLLQLSIFFGKASVTAILVSINPLFVSLLALLLIREKIKLIQLFSIMAGAIGVILIIFGELDFNHSSYKNLNLGIVLALSAAFVFALYTVLTKKTILLCGNIITNSLSFIFGSVMLFVLSIAFNKKILFEPSASNLLFILYLGIVLTGVAYLLYFEGMKGLTAASASQYFFLKPILASILAIVFLSEKLSLTQMIGMLVIVISLSFSNFLSRFLIRKTAN